MCVFARVCVLMCLRLCLCAISCVCERVVLCGDGSGGGVLAVLVEVVVVTVMDGLLVSHWFSWTACLTHVRAHTRTHTHTHTMPLPQLPLPPPLPRPPLPPLPSLAPPPPPPPTPPPPPHRHHHDHHHHPGPVSPPILRSDRLRTPATATGVCFTPFCPQKTVGFVIVN